MTSIDVRAVTAEDRDRVADVVEKAFGETMPPEVVDVELAVYEWDRGLVGLVDGDVVGHTNLFSLTMTVPGGPLPVAGVSGVGVLPTHRRRGVLSALMRHQLAELHQTRREAVAALNASEPAIYGRFGYGLATEQLRVEIPRLHHRLRPVPGSDSVRVRYAPPADCLAECTKVRQAVVAARPGLFSFDQRWQERSVGDLPMLRDGASALRCVLAEHPDGGVGGYAYFRTRHNWGEGGPNGTVSVQVVHAVDPAAYAALWGFLLDQDLMATTRARVAPDDRLLAMLVDVRRAGIRVNDDLWIRLVDVDRALAGRTYSHPVDVVLEISDEVCPWNARRWQLAADTGGATCEPTTADPDLSLDVADLGAAYLGRPTLAALGRAGFVREHRPGALAACAAAFRNDPLPWCDTGF